MAALALARQALPKNADLVMMLIAFGARARLLMRWIRLPRITPALTTATRRFRCPS